MKTTVTYAGFQVDPGTKVQGYLPVKDSEVQIPFTIINGSEDGKQAVFTSGIHSGEYPGIECLVELAQEIDPAQVKGSIVLVHPCNPTGFAAQISYFVPEDGKNLGRAFPGDAAGTLSERIGDAITQAFFAVPCDMNVDCHGGDLHERLSTFVFAPKNGTPEARATALAVTDFMNCKYVVMTGTGLTNYLVERGIPSIVLERGDRGLWSRAEVEDYKRDLYNVLRYFHILDGAVNYHGPKPYVFERCDMAYAPVSGCWYRSVELEEHVQAGQKLGEIRDFHGNVLHTLYADYDGVVHSYWAALSIRKGQLMVGYGA